MTYKISFYSQKVEADTLSLPPGILAHLLRTLELVEEFGPELGRPHTAPLGNGLFEIRASGKGGTARSLFCTLKHREIVILLTVMKKTQALRKREMELARKRLKEVRRDG